MVFLSYDKLLITFKKSHMAGIFRFLAFAVYIVCGIIALVLGLRLIAEMWGTFWTVVSLVIFPFPLYIAPLIAIFRNGDWTLFFVSYGGSIAAMILNGISLLFSRD